MAKRYFADNGIEYREADVSDDREALREMVEMTQQYGVPVIRVGNRARIGWNPQQFEKLRSAA